MSNKADGILEKTASLLDIPADVFAGLTHIEIIGTRELLIENHKGILEYNDNEVKLNGGKTIIRITGQRLVVTSMNENELRMSGQLDGIAFIGL